MSMGKYIVRMRIFIPQINHTPGKKRNRDIPFIIFLIRICHTLYRNKRPVFLLVYRLL